MLLNAYCQKRVIWDVLWCKIALFAPKYPYIDCLYHFCLLRKRISVLLLISCFIGKIVVLAILGKFWEALKFKRHLFLYCKETKIPSLLENRNPQQFSSSALIKLVLGLHIILPNILLERRFFF